MGWSRFVAVVALTTRQKSKEHSSSSPRKAVRPLVVKQTEYSKRERTARCGKSSKVFILSFRAISLFSWFLVGFFLTKHRWFFTFQGGPARSLSCLFALAGKSQHTEVKQAAKARHSVWQHCPRPPTPRVATGTEGSRSSGGKGQSFKESKWSIYQSMPKIELYLNCTALLENSQLS